MNAYRVDRSLSNSTPCGMASIIYWGNSWQTARKVFNAARPGIDKWSRENAAYGVILSVWDEPKREFIVKCSKGLS